MDNEVVGIDYSVEKAFQGLYYIGHTPVLTLAQGANAWGAILNPAGSRANIYINVFTVSNYSGVPFQSQVWLNAPLDGASESPHISPSNLAKRPIREPYARLLYAGGVLDGPDCGISLLSRVAQPNTTVVAEYGGTIVIPPGSSFTVYLFAPPVQRIRAELAFGFWEDYA